MTRGRDESPAASFLREKERQARDSWSDRPVRRRRYVARLADFERGRLGDRLALARASKSEAEVADFVAGALETVQGNLEAGDCVLKVASAALLVREPDDLGGVGGAIVVVFPDFSQRGAPYSDDARLLGSVGDAICGEVDLVAPLRGVGDTMDVAAPFLVDAVLARGRCDLADRARLVRRWTAWLRGVPWDKSRLSWMHRPSLGSWVGFPWEPAYVCEHRGCGLLGKLGDLEAAALEITVEYARDAKSLRWPQHVRDCLVPLWAKDGGATPDARAALARAKAAARDARAPAAKKARTAAA